MAKVLSYTGYPINVISGAKWNKQNKRYEGGEVVFTIEAAKRRLQCRHSYQAVTAINLGDDDNPINLDIVFDHYSDYDDVPDLDEMGVDYIVVSPKYYEAISKSSVKKAGYEKYQDRILVIGEKVFSNETGKVVGASSLVLPGYYVD